LKKKKQEEARKRRRDRAWLSLLSSPALPLFSISFSGALLIFFTIKKGKAVRRSRRIRSRTRRRSRTRSRTRRRRRRRRTREINANMNPLVKFRPTDEHLFAHYLQRKATGAPLPPGLIEECDLYSQEPWRIFDTTSEQTFYVFTTLRKNKSRVLRTAGSGTWKEQHTMRIPDILGELVGYKKSFKFQGGRGSSATSGRWIMYEFSMCDERVRFSFHVY